MTRWFSLKRRLLLWLLAGVGIAWLGAVGVAFFEVRHEVMDLLEKGSRHERFEKHVQHELAEHLLMTMLTPLLFGLPVLGLWLWFATRRGLAPLDALARDLAQRSPQRLDPLSPSEAPLEAKTLLDTLNALLARLAAALENERRFTGDAAHELRTPIAAILAQAQVAARARDAVERDHALDQLAMSARRASHLVDQLLMLARLDPAQALPKTDVRLDRLVTEVCAEHGAAALAKEIALALDAPDPVVVRGNEAMLRVLVRNLLDNALRYTPAGGKVGVRVTADELVVADDGPGIPPAARARVLERFHRLAGQESEGCGLGLSIVAKIAELHEARLTLGSGLDGKGLGVTVAFASARGKA